MDPFKACRLMLTRALVIDDADRFVVERKVVRLQAKIDRHAASAGEALPQPHDVRVDMVFPADGFPPPLRPMRVL